MTRRLGPRDRVAVFLGTLPAARPREGSGRGGGTALPGLVATSVAPGVTEQLARLPDAGSVVVTGTNGKTTTAHLLAGIAALPASTRSRTVPAPTSNAASSAYLDARDTAGEHDGPRLACSRSTRRHCRACSRRCGRAPCCSSTSSATSSTATARSTRWPRVARDAGRRRQRAHARAQRRRPADRTARRDRPRRSRHVRHRGPRSRAGGRRARLGRALLRVRCGVPLRGGVPRPGRALVLRRLRPRPPHAGCRRPRRARRQRRHHVSRWSSRASASRWSCRWRGCTPSTTRSARLQPRTRSASRPA